MRLIRAEKVNFGNSFLRAHLQISLPWRSKPAARIKVRFYYLMFWASKQKSMKNNVNKRHLSDNFVSNILCLEYFGCLQLPKIGSRFIASVCLLGTAEERGGNVRLADIAVCFQVSPYFPAHPQIPARNAAKDSRLAVGCTIYFPPTDLFKKSRSHFDW